MVSKPVVRALGEELRQVQLGVSTSGGCEAAAHAAWRYVRDRRHRRGLVKIDKRNAFNNLRRDSFLSVTRVRIPGLYNLLWQAYSSPTRLFFVRKGLPQRQASSRETQLDPHSLVYRSMKQPEVSSLNLMCGIWTMLPSETPRRGFTTI